MSENLIENFPLAKENIIKGTRRLAREKILQILLAYSICKVEVNDLFNYIFYRVYNFDDIEVEPNKLLKPDEIIELESDYAIEWKDEEIEFGKKLIQTVLEQKEYVDNLLSATSSNWNIDRMANIDKTIIHIAIAELTSFPEIPVKVTLNEALEIAKDYSTDKSSVFINGVLDSIKSELELTGRISKAGRGLKNE